MPNGFATTADAYRLFLSETGLDEQIQQTLASLDTADIADLRRCGADVRHAILEARLPRARASDCASVLATVPGKGASCGCCRSQQRHGGRPAGCKLRRTARNILECAGSLATDRCLPSLLRFAVYVPTVDVLGPMLAALDDRLGMTPRGRPGLSYELRKEQFDRIDAVDFTLAHDDGKRLEDLYLADCVLVGVSRVSKSVTCFYLAARGIRAANVPLLAGQKVPPELLRLEPNKVVGLTMNAKRLRSIREARICRLSNVPVPDYVDELAEELRHARSLMSRHKWPCIDVSYMATEEVAHEVLSLIDSRGD